MPLLILGLGDMGGDAPGAQVLADRARGVGLVAAECIRPGPWPPEAAADLQLLQQRQKHRRVAGLAGTQQHHQRQPTAVDELVDLRREPAARAAQGMIRRLWRRRLARGRPWAGPADSCSSIQPPVLAATSGRVLMSTSDRRVHRDRPVDLSGLVGCRGQPLQHPVPGAVSGHAPVPGPDRLPGTEDLGQIAPGDAGPIPVDDRLDHGPRVGEGPALAACGAGSMSAIIDHWASESTWNLDICSVSQDGRYIFFRHALAARADRVAQGNVRTVGAAWWRAGRSWRPR